MASVYLQTIASRELMPENPRLLSSHGNLRRSSSSSCHTHRRFFRMIFRICFLGFDCGFVLGSISLERSTTTSPCLSSASAFTILNKPVLLKIALCCKPQAVLLTPIGRTLFKKVLSQWGALPKDS